MNIGMTAWLLGKKTDPNPTLELLHMSRSSTNKLNLLRGSEELERKTFSIHHNIDKGSIHLKIFRIFYLLVE